ncbi:Spore germination protein YndE [compost metagenome]
MKFSYIHIFYLPFIFFSVVFISLVSIKDVDVLNLLPITGNHITLSSLSSGMLSSASVYQGTFVLILLVPFMRKPKQVLKASTAALLVIGVIYMTIVVISIGMFGAEETKLLKYPTLEAARSISFGAGLLERFDGIFIITWVISVYTTIFTNYYLAAYAFRELTKFKDHRLVSSFLLPFVFLLSLLPDNIFQAHDITNITAFLGLILLTFYPFLLWLVAVIRKKGGLPHA